MEREEFLHFSTAPVENHAEVKKILESVSNTHDKYTAIKNAVHAQELTEEERRAKQANKNKKSKKNKKKKKKKKSLFRKILDLFPQQGDSIFEVFRKMVFLASSMVFLVCIVLIGEYFWDNYKARQILEPIRQVYIKQVEEEKTKPKTAEEEIDDSYRLLEAAKALLEINSDVVGYIHIPNKTGEEDSYPISYPVVQRKNKADGNSYYLDKNINKEQARSGSIFLDYRASFDYMLPDLDKDGKPTDIYRRVTENSDNLVIYGHNMHDFSMFGGLKRYTNSSCIEYYANHPIVELNSNFVQYQYKIFGIIIVDANDETDTKFEYWNKVDFEDEKDFYSYVNEVKRRTIQLTDVDVKYGDKLLTLSTCNSTFSNGRLVVFARLLRDEEDLYEGCTSVENTNVKWSNSYYTWHKVSYDPDAEFVPYGEED